MKKLVIKIDFDDTIIFFTGLFVQAYNHLFPEKPALRSLDIDRWELKQVANLNEEELQECFRWIRAGNYDLIASPTDRNFEYWLNRLLKDGHDLEILTANPPEVIPKIKRYLKAYGVRDIPVRCVKNTLEKLEGDFDVIVDDSPDLVRAMKDDDRHMILYWAKHNKSVNRYAKRSAGNWQAVYEHIKEIAEES